MSIVLLAFCCKTMEWNSADILPLVDTIPFLFVEASAPFAFRLQDVSILGVRA
jgi:hypothetical protein